jgi:cytochrome c biogenesis protein CcdA
MINYLLFDSLLLGVQHSFEPDHMAAVSVLASEHKDSRNRWKMVWRSSHWALGHSLTLILFATLVLILKSTFSLQISETVEWFIGPLMIWLGLMAIRRNFKKQVHENIKTTSGKISKSFWVGMIHGLAGTGTACAVALTLAAKDSFTAVYIIILQSAGIIISMSAYGYLFAFSFSRFAAKKQIVLKIVNYTIGAFSILIGAMTLHEAFAG